MELIRQFANLSQMTPSELGEAARLILQNIQVEWLAPLLTQRYEQPHGEHAARQYSQVFGQRLDGALRDIEIGFIGGRNMSGSQERNVQGNAFELLKAIEQATQNSAVPVALEQFGNLQMTEEEAKAAFLYLKGKGLIDANFKIFYAARISAAGLDAIREAESTPEKSPIAFPAITHNYYMNIHSMTGSNVQQGTTNSSITATQIITTEQLAEVLNLVEQLDRALPTLPGPLQEQTRKVLAELRGVATVPAPDASRLRRGLESLKHIMEHAAGHLIAAGALTFIEQLLARLPH
jgi:hypothetical protein